MSDLGNISQGNHINLDGSPLCPGQTPQGNFYSDFQNYLEKKYPEFLPYLSTNELAIYEEGLTYYRFESSRDKAMKGMAWSNVMDKIPEDVLLQYQDRVSTAWEIEMKEKKKRRKVHAGHELGSREFTLTYSPKWFSDEEARRQMTKAIHKLIKYYKEGDQRIISFRAVGEVGKEGLSHVHGMYKLLGGVKISNKNFGRAYTPWDPDVKLGPTGHKGGHHATVKHEADFLGYMEKEVTTAWLDVSWPPSCDPN